MSKLKNPAVKKKASLTRDRRKADGENGKAARKNIPRAKARAQRKHRHAVHQALTAGEALRSEEVLESVETTVAEAAKTKKARGFRKKPDEPLGEHIAKQQGRRLRRASKA